MKPLWKLMRVVGNLIAAVGFILMLLDFYPVLVEGRGHLSAVLFSVMCVSLSVGALGDALNASVS